MITGTVLELIVSLRNTFIYLSFMLSIPSVTLYILQIVCIFRHKQFHNPFYYLFVMRAIPDLLYLADSFYGYRLPTIFGDRLLPYYRNLPNWALAMFYFLSNYTFHAENLSTAFLMLNRLTAILVPMKQDKLWRKLLPFAMVLVFGAPVFVCYYVFGMTTSIQVMRNDDNTTSFLIMEAQNGTYLSHVNYSRAALSVIFLVICVLINLATFASYRFAFRRSTTNTQNLTDIELKLLVYAVATFSGHIFSSSLMILLYVYATEPRMLAVMYSQYPWIMDSATVVLSSWLLLWASDTFRQQLLADILPKWCYAPNGGNFAFIPTNSLNNINRNANRNNNKHHHQVAVVCPANVVNMSL